MATVLKKFRDKFTKEVYNKGDSYSHEDENRIAFLLGKGFIEEKSKQPPQTEGDIKHVGGGYYELPNGEKVKGKEEALKAIESSD